MIFFVVVVFYVCVVAMDMLYILWDKCSR